jgi:biotin transporter BioY
MGWFAERMIWSKPITLLIGGLLSCVVQMGLGVWMLAQFVGWSLVWTMGLFPFIPGEILKVIAVCFAFTPFKNHQKIN